MDELLQNPAVQGGLAPFIVALALAAALARTRLLALAQLGGFLAVVALVIGFSFESLTAVKKLVLVALASGAAVLALESGDPEPSLAKRTVLLAALAAGCIWMLWRPLAQQAAWPAALAALLAVAYTLTLVEATLRVGIDPVRGSVAGLMLGLGTGLLAVLGASAVLGLVGIAAGASAGATLLVQMVRGRPAASGATISLPASAIAALAGVLAVVTASLPWYCLIPALAVPVATRLAPHSVRPLWLRALLSAASALLPMLAAIGLAWAAVAT